MNKLQNGSIAVGAPGSNARALAEIADSLLSGGDKKRTPNDLMLFLIESIGNNNDVDGLNYQGVAEDLITEFPKILEA